MNEEELLEVLRSFQSEYDEFKNSLSVDNLSYNEYVKLIDPYLSKINTADRKYRLAKTPIFENMGNHDGLIMDISRFINDVKDGLFIDYDGWGKYIKDDKISDITIHPSDVKYNSVRKDFDKIIWYNR